MPTSPSETAGCRASDRANIAIGLQGSAYPRNFNRHEYKCCGDNERQCGSHCANLPEWSFLNFNSPSEPSDDFFASQKATSYEQSENVKPHPNRGGQSCPKENKGQINFM